MLHLLLLSLLPTAHSLAWSGAQETAVPSPPSADGFTPKPTKAPESLARLSNNHEALRMIRRQQQSGGASRYPNTCGYLDSNGAFPFMCPDNGACAYASVNFGFGCCSGTSSSSDGNVYFTNGCSVDTTTTGCFASSEADQCTGSCTTKAAICTTAGNPICRKVVQVGTGAADTISYTQWDCVPEGAKTEVTILPTFSTFVDVTPNPYLSTGYVLSGTNVVATGSASASGITAPTASPTKTPGGDGDNRKKKSNTGAIAGGVVGGLAAIGLLVGLVIWLLMKKKRKARQDAGAVQEVEHVTYGDGK